MWKGMGRKEGGDGDRGENRNGRSAGGEGGEV